MENLRNMNFYNLHNSTEAIYYKQLLCQTIHYPLLNLLPQKGEYKSINANLNTI